MTERNNIWPKLAAVAAIGAVAGFGGGWAATTLGGPADEDFEAYLLANPEILPEAMQALQQKEMAARLDPVREAVMTPYRGAVLGNPNGSKVLVEFSDYACGYCRQSAKDVEALVARDPELKVVIREFPILSEGSVHAARMALAAAEQGKFEAFHHAMFAGGSPDEAGVEAAANAAGLDIEAANRAIAAGKYDQELAQNQQLGRVLGFDGTPAWIVGDAVLAGAVGERELAEAIAEQTG
ncbi:DsbA family protein [Alteriqipengyuania flavescens]|uniref:DsbA family protein n=1 Tax=Alteriqipengyuania flavescens TaxID=3053610 RepID=UPI0025B3353E|nr:DsbA family protein [Alteriqipengyuania flavescens]WJY19663.1 DsbA family protein [Alteriqipengyuania flavescens]WJY25603.1 DsbA family protein [Alteriqipengyuania flavescens]